MAPITTCLCWSNCSREPLKVMPLRLTDPQECFGRKLLQLIEQFLLLAIVVLLVDQPLLEHLFEMLELHR